MSFQQGNNKMNGFYFKSKYRDEMKLYGRNWPVSNPKAVILLIPGYGDHCERYQYLTSFFNDHNIAVVGVDLRGQGHSGGERGFTPHINAYFADITSGIEEARRLYPELPLIMLGDGIGAAILCIYTDRRYIDPLPYNALIACTPSILFPKKPSFVHMAFVRAFAFLAPHVPISGPAHIYTDNSEAIRSRETDPLFHDRCPANVVNHLCEFSLHYEENGCNFSIPTLIQHGSKAFLPIEKVRAWVNRSKKVNEKTITFKDWEGFHAELHNDDGRNKVFEFTLKWIEDRLELFTNTQAS